MSVNDECNHVPVTHPFAQTNNRPHTQTQRATTAHASKAQPVIEYTQVAIKCVTLNETSCTNHLTEIGKFFLRIEFIRDIVALYSSGAIFDMSCDGNSVLNRFERPKLKSKKRKKNPMEIFIKFSSLL